MSTDGKPNTLQVIDLKAKVVTRAVIYRRRTHGSSVVRDSGHLAVRSVALSIDTESHQQQTGASTEGDGIRSVGEATVPCRACSCSTGGAVTANCEYL